MNCAKCGVSVMARPLIRVNPIGEDGEFWCWDCLKKHEPELYKNLKDDLTRAERLIIDEVYHGKAKI